MTRLPRITHFKVSRAKLLATEDTRAGIVQLWVDGHGQKAIARMFGYENATLINQIISRFCVRWAPDHTEQRYYGLPYRFPNAHGDDRRQLASLCLQRYRTDRDGKTSNIVSMRAR